VSRTGHCGAVGVGWERGGAVGGVSAALVAVRSVMTLTPSAWARQWARARRWLRSRMLVKVTSPRVARRSIAVSCQASARRSMVIKDSFGC
jgi:hypothetical protein